MRLSYDFERFEQLRPRGLNRRRAARHLLELRAALDDPANLNYVPPKSDVQLLLATWNIQDFGGTDRYDESLWYIAEIVSRFDLVAVQEVKQSLADLETLTQILGPWWRFIVSDVTAGDAGKQERMAYLFDTRQVRFSGLAGEIVLPPVEQVGGGTVPASQLVRTPYLAGFKAGWFDFVVSTAHLIWGKAQADHAPRVEEVRQLAEFLVRRKAERGAWSRNMVLLGDFNLFDPGGAAAQALAQSGFVIPHGREDLRATNVGKVARFYDQIAFCFERMEAAQPTAMGVVDYFESVYTDAQFPSYQDGLRTAAGKRPGKPYRYYRNSWRRREMSDHLLLWAQLPIDFSGQHLAGHAGG